MMSISSQAGRRLARARHRYLLLRELGNHSSAEYIEAVEELDSASDAVADELIANGFHSMDGDD